LLEWPVGMLPVGKAPDGKIPVGRPPDGITPDGAATPELEMPVGTNPVEATGTELLAETIGAIDAPVLSGATVTDKTVGELAELDVKFCDTLTGELAPVLRTTGAVPTLVIDTFAAGTVALTVVLGCCGAPPAQ